MSLRHIIIALALVVQICSLKMLLNLSTSELPICLYEHLRLGQKYSVSTRSFGHQKYRIDIYRQMGNSWEEVVNRMVANTLQTVHKLSDVETTYMFCFSNAEDSILRISAQIMTGVELGSFQHLPNKNDQELIDLKIDWLQKQKDNLVQTINRIGQKQANAVNLNSSSGKSMLILAFVGLIFIIGNNIFFFMRAKKQLKDRKLI